MIAFSAADRRATSAGFCAAMFRFSPGSLARSYSCGAAFAPLSIPLPAMKEAVAGCLAGAMNLSEPERTGSRWLDVCVSVLLGAMALYGAVLIVQAIWVWLCIGMAVIASIAAIWWILRTRF